MAGLREAVDLFLDALIEDLADVAVDLVPDRQIAELGLVDTVQSLRDAIDKAKISHERQRLFDSRKKLNRTIEQADDLYLA